MPQMSFLLWLNLYFYFILMFMLIMLIINFFFIKFPLMNNMMKYYNKNYFNYMW